MRPLKIIRPFLKQAEASCLWQMGNTRVLCVASVEERVPPFAEEKSQGWVTAEYSMLPRSGLKRSPRRKVSSGGRVLEISRLIGRSLRSAVDLSALKGYSILIDCDVLEADGGTRTASINGAFVAMADAIKALYVNRHISRWPIKDYLGAVSVGLVKGRHVVDLCYQDDSQADVDMNVVMTASGRFVELQGSAEGATFSQKELSTMIASAQRGLQKVFRLQKQVLGSVAAPKRLAGRNS